MNKENRIFYVLGLMFFFVVLLMALVENFITAIILSVACVLIVIMMFLSFFVGVSLAGGYEHLIEFLKKRRNK